MNWSEINNLDIKNLASAPVSVRAVIIALIFFGTVFLGWYLLWSDALTALDRAKSEETELRSTYASKKYQAINHALYRQRLSETEKMLASMLRQLPNKSEIDALLTEVSQVGVGRGLNFQLFRPDPEKQADFYATIPVAIKASGKYHDIGGFVSDMAQLPRIVTLHDLSLAQNADNTALVMEARIETYRYLDEVELAAKSKKTAGKDDKK